MTANVFKLIVLVLTGIGHWLGRQRPVIVVLSVVLGVILGSNLWFFFCGAGTIVQYIDGGYQRLGRQHYEAVDRVMQSVDKERDRWAEILKAQIEANKRQRAELDSMRGKAVVKRKGE